LKNPEEEETEMLKHLREEIPEYAKVRSEIRN
jgi:hypothetical protein